jgi:hypothetical protein
MLSWVISSGKRKENAYFPKKLKGKGHFLWLLSCIYIIILSEKVPPFLVKKKTYCASFSFI